MLSFVAVDLQLEESLQCTFLQAVTVCCLHQPQLTEDLFDTSSANGECHSVYSCDQRVASCKTKAFRVQQGVSGLAEYWYGWRSLRIPRQVLSLHSLYLRATTDDGPAMTVNDTFYSIIMS